MQYFSNFVVMANRKINCSCNVFERTRCSFISTLCRKLTLETVYAGLIVFFVPSVLCEPDLLRLLSYDKIYNSTQYAQLRHISRPYNKSVITSDRFNVKNITKGNEVQVYNYNEGGKAKLLVGFARDPFRYSVLDEDYARGVRYVEPQPYKGDNRGKRGVLHLYNMIYCATGCDPLSYKGYGCYCGFLGTGRPTDGIDRCCKMHDQCYENIYCPFFTVYFQPYYWKCYRGEPLCALENHLTQHQFVNGCAARLCECDRLFAMCVKRYSCPRGRSFCHSSPVRLLQNILMFR